MILDQFGRPIQAPRNAFLPAWVADEVHRRSVAACRPRWWPVSIFNPDGSICPPSTRGDVVRAQQPLVTWGPDAIGVMGREGGSRKCRIQS